MARRKCHHCAEWLTDEQRKTHDCWTTAEKALIKDLAEDLQDAWERIRETASDYFFVRHAVEAPITDWLKEAYDFVA